ncbi:MAG: co-chaperone YbbN [Planctomycetaceae bacterium]|nr:co-chaperone YbbN [Planctomycetaceae bacterium]
MNDSGEERSEWVVDTVQQSFHEDVFDRSKQIPVVVDFWAAWCAPCKLLTPVLEKLAVEGAGKFVLVKADTERVAEAATEFQVSSIPAVFGVSGGEIVDFFHGVLPEEQIRGWLGQLLQHHSIVAVRALEETDPPAAEIQYRALTEQAPNDSSLAIGLARTLLAQGKDDDCRSVLDQLEQRGFLEPEAEQLLARLNMQSRQGGDLESIRTQAADDPQDVLLQWQLAEALSGEKQYPEALEICLAVVQHDRHGLGENARKLMVDIFRILPEEDELIGEYRRKLAMALY